MDRGGGCCAPGCEESSSEYDLIDQPTDSLELEPITDCILGLNYAFEGVPCQIAGGLHTTMWNGGHHNFQGQPGAHRADDNHTLKNQFYYVAPCSDMSALDLPMTILGTHNVLELGLDYLVLELYDRMDEETATYNIYLSSSIASYAVRDTEGVSTDHDDTKADAPTALNMLECGMDTAIGDRFSALLTIDEATDSTTLELTVDGENTITIFVKAMHYVRYTMHYVLIEQAEAYKCASCGLCGNFKDAVDFKAETQELERCDGSMVAFHTGDDADVPETYDPDGWTWEKNFFENECVSADSSTVQYDIASNNGDDFELVLSCDEAIQPKVHKQCEASLNRLSACCSSMGYMCDALLSDCKKDVCAMSTFEGVGNEDLIQPAIDSTVVAAIEAACVFPRITSAFEGANAFVSYEHVGCWADDVSARAIDVMRSDIDDINECFDFCADDYKFFGVIDLFDAQMMCFCTNSEADYQQYGTSDICNNGAGAQDMPVIKNGRKSIGKSAMDVYKIMVMLLTKGSANDAE